MDRADAGRTGWRRLRSIFEPHDVPAMWAVGHVLLDGCDGVHADHLSIDGWFDCERSEWRSRPDLRLE